MSSDTSKPITRGEEPSLAVRPRPVPFFLRRRFLFPFTPVAFLAIIGFVALLVSANLLLPFERLVTLEGAIGSKADFFDDEQVKELLLRHHLRVHITRQGSRDAATGDLASLDFVFPSGQPAAELVIKRRREAKQYNAVQLHAPAVHQPHSTGHLPGLRRDAARRGGRDTAGHHRLRPAVLLQPRHAPLPRSGARPEVLG